MIFFIIYIVSCLIMFGANNVVLRRRLINTKTRVPNFNAATYTVSTTYTNNIEPSPVDKILTTTLSISPITGMGFLIYQGCDYLNNKENYDLEREIKKEQDRDIREIRRQQEISTVVAQKMQLTKIKEDRIAALERSTGVGPAAEIEARFIEEQAKYNRLLTETKRLSKELKRVKNTLRVDYKPEKGRAYEGYPKGYVDASYNGRPRLGWEERREIWTEQE